MNITEQTIDDNNVKVSEKITTTFVDDHETHDVTPDYVQPLPLEYVRQHEDSIVTMISHYLGKPLEIVAGTFTTGDTSSTFPTWYNMPWTLISKTVYYPKVSGYLGFRATLVFTLQVNAQRFQQGRYMMVYVPCGGVHQQTYVTQWCNRHAATTTSRTQLPHAEIDLNSQTSVTLRIPFSSCEDFYSFDYNTDVSSSKWGALRIFPYTALVTGSGGNTAKFTLWGHFEDIELVGQTTPLELQSNSSKEQKSKDMGPVQSVALKVKRASAYFKGVPLISDFVMPVQWASDIVAGVASVFGWSSPANLDKQYRVERMIMAYATNVNKPDTVAPLSYMVDNEVQVMSSGLTNADEMDITFLAQQYSYQALFDWSTVDIDDQLLSVLDVGLYPNGNAPLTHVDGVNTYTDFTPAQFVGNYFSMWRGTVKFKFKFVKTEFHSGRLSFNFIPKSPGLGIGNTRSLQDIAPYLHRHVIDIREVKEVELEFPYISLRPYCNTFGNGDVSFGVLHIRIVDPLVAPDTVSSSIKVLVEHCMGADVEFAGRAAFELKVGEIMQVQSMSTTIGSTSSNSNSNITSQYCIGERIKSLRSIGKRYETLYFLQPVYGVPSVADHRPRDFAYIHNVLPFAVEVDPAITDNGICNQDFYSIMAHIYTFSRGGVRIKALPLYGERFTSANVRRDDSSRYDQQVVYATLAEARYNTRAYLRSSGGPTNGAQAPTQIVPKTFYGQHQRNYAHFTAVQDTADREISVQVPQYSRHHSRPNVTHIVGLENYDCQTYDYNTPLYLSFYKPGWADVAPDQHRGFSLKVYRAFSDDTNFSGFCSIPPMRVTRGSEYTFV